MPSAPLMGRATNSYQAVRDRQAGSNPHTPRMKYTATHSIVSTPQNCS